jgi:hypothetical protein
MTGVARRVPICPALSGAVRLWMRESGIAGCRSAPPFRVRSVQASDDVRRLACRTFAAVGQLAGATWFPGPPGGSQLAPPDRERRPSFRHVRRAACPRVHCRVAAWRWGLSCLGFVRTAWRWGPWAGRNAPVDDAVDARSQHPRPSGPLRSSWTSGGRRTAPRQSPSSQASSGSDLDHGRRVSGERRRAGLPLPEPALTLTGTTVVGRAASGAGPASFIPSQL